MIFDILTIFPDFFESPLQEGIIRRALGAGKIDVNIRNIREYALDRHKMTDDRPFGGGEGMVMKPEPLAACIDDIVSDGRAYKVIALSPRGKQYTQQVAQQLAAEPRLILVCGRYEGIDQRFTDRYVDQEISIGDYVLTGGELAAMIMVDSITRLLPGVLGCCDSAANDTFSRGLLKHSQYTRPREFQGQTVPQALLSGNHAAIEQFRLTESVRLTLKHRPDLLAEAQFSSAEKKMLRQEGLLDAIQDINQAP
ncbi:tRNA (guanosine(37)-N1)-methyltransferase TrmD [Desulfogranum marinum]|uniref:tRNA (guanosine(37)-N1)-methyltransferase TrmD n=1 Tax=Desulfogranum marinum TaxID=453220 RepID=UPI0029C96D9C|nr:tRNA (guanosine(37)-N1)-methyltransferase TrmD [Desulfogranum marinum]